MMENPRIVNSVRNPTFQNVSLVAILASFLFSFCGRPDCETINKIAWKEKTLQSVQNQIVSDSIEIRQLGIEPRYRKAIKFIQNKVDAGRQLILSELCKRQFEKDSAKTIIVEHYWHEMTYGHSFLILHGHEKASLFTGEGDFAKIDFINTIDADSMHTTFDSEMRKLEDILIVTEIKNDKTVVRVIMSPTKSQINIFFK